MNSSLFWIASSRADISNARAALKTFSQEGVLDELGFLVLLGAISDRLYPAVSTIMTRARYLVFVPAIYRHMEERGLGRKRDPDEIARNLQYDLRNALLATDRDSEGVIGKESGRRVERTPSNTYWSALGLLGIATAPLSEAAYQQRLADPDSARAQDDDDSFTGERQEPFWDRTFPTNQALDKKGDFPAGTSFELTHREATDLATRYREIYPEDGSLISHLIETGRASGRIPDYAHPWTVPAIPTGLAKITDHARRLSLFARGATLQYHSMLHEKCRSQDPGTREAFVSWWKEARNDLLAWDLGEFGRLDFVANVRRQGDLLFLAEWINTWRSNRTGAIAFANPDARERLRQREYEVRRHKGRLRSAYHLKTWKPPAAYDGTQLYGLTYRHRVGTQFAIDITSAL